MAPPCFMSYQPNPARTELSPSVSAASSSPLLPGSSRQRPSGVSSGGFQWQLVAWKACWHMGLSHVTLRHPGRRLLSAWGLLNLWLKRFGFAQWEHFTEMSVLCEELPRPVAEVGIVFVKSLFQKIFLYDDECLMQFQVCFCAGSPHW